MPYLTLYRKYRPQYFSQVVGQDEAVEVLKREVASGKTGHAYLFSGPRGCGKTTVARLLAKAVDCENPGKEGEPCGSCENCRSITSGNSLDVIEIDGASNRGIDEVRELKEHVSLSPFSARYKIYIIDEVHMLTDAAFNALLKTLEEPPASVIFIFATTEPSKVPSTIRSRCQHIPFHRIDASLMVPCIKDIAGREGSNVEERALWDIAREADGSLRDALSLLEQVLSLGGEVSSERVRALFGGGSRKELERLTSALRSDRKKAFLELEDSFRKGLSGGRLLEGFFSVFRDLWIIRKWGPEMASHLPLAEEERNFAISESAFWPEDLLWEGMEFFASLMPKARWGMRSDVVLGLLMAFFERVPVGESAAGDAEKEVAEVAPEREEPSRDIEKVEEELVTPEAEKEQKPESQAVEETLEKMESLSVGAASEKLSHEAWKHFIESFFPDDVSLYCALLSSVPMINSEKLCIVFDEKDRVCFELCKIARNAAKIAGRKEKLEGVSKILLCCGDEETDTEASPIPGMSSDSPGAPSERPKEESEKVEIRRQEAKKKGKTTEDGSSSKVEDLKGVMSLFDAELLLLREEASENGENGGDIIE